MFTSIHNHTMYSNLKLLDSINRIPQLVDKAIEYGFNGIAITDHEILSGHIEALEYGDKIKKEHPDFKIILGNEIYLINQAEYKQPGTRFWHFILLAKDLEGYMQIRELSSRARDRMYVSKGQKRTPTFYEDFKEVIGDNKGHLIFSTACLGGYLNECFKQHDKQNLFNFLNWMVDVAGKENVFIEIQDSDSEDQKAFNKFAIQLAKQIKLPFIVTQDAHYLNKEDLVIENVFLNSKQEGDREVAEFYQYTYVKPESEIKQILNYLPEEDVQASIDNTQLIYQMIQPFDLRKDTIIPQRKLPPFTLKHLLKDWYDKEPAIKFFSESPWDQDRFLLHSIENGLIEKKIIINQEIADRINIELDVLKYITEQVDQPMSAYLNLVQEIVDIGWETSFVGVSRGCFTEDAQILMGDGFFKNIKDVQVGELVYTHTGKIKPVLETHQYDVNEVLYQIKVQGHPEFTCTNNHQIYGFHQKKNQRLMSNKGKTGTSIIPNWIEAQQLKEGDFIATPKLTHTTKEKHINNLNNFVAEEATYSDYLEDDKNYYNRICTIHTIPFKGKVYDLSVQDDTSYTVNGCSVHNSAMSFYINYLIGIVQASPLPYNIPYWRFMNTATVPQLTPEEKAAGKKVSMASSAPDVDMDFSPEKSQEIMQKMRAHYGDDNILNTLTYKTESLKSAINTCGRGLGILPEETHYLSGLIPTSRGHVYSLKECEEGDEEKGFDPHPEVIAKIKAYDGLYEAIQKVEGLISGCGVHASAVYFFETGYLHCCSLMRAPNGTRITGFDYRAVDACSGLKMDFLYTDCQSKLMKTMDLLIKFGQIEWQGTLRNTYNKYLHPDVLVYNDPEMWRKMSDGEISNLFQFDSVQGAVCIKRTRPENVKQLGAANAVMRLMGDGSGETPLDKYVRFRNNPNEWDKEMTAWKLTDHEKNLLKKYLSDKFGYASEQEDLMQIVQDPEIGNFSLYEATKFRKCVSKKKLSEIEKYKQLFFTKNCDEIQTEEE